MRMASPSNSSVASWALTSRIAIGQPLERSTRGFAPGRIYPRTIAIFKDSEAVQGGAPSHRLSPWLQRRFQPFPARTRGVALRIRASYSWTFESPTRWLSGRSRACTTSPRVARVLVRRSSPREGHRRDLREGRASTTRRGVLGDPAHRQSRAGGRHGCVGVDLRPRHGRVRGRHGRSTAPTRQRMPLVRGGCGSSARW
jgi:hypothetical protein